MKSVLILAPHIDDEMIGCWSVLSNPENQVTVHYFYELTDERKKEAQRMLDFFDPKGERVFAVNWTGDEQDVRNSIGHYTEVYVPSRRDSHADHKALCAKFRHYATHFYSVDMHDGVYLGEKESGAKRDALNYCYPSQYNLWNNNDKYWLFEAISKKDYQEYVTIKYVHRDITIPLEYFDAVNTLLQNKVQARGLTANQMMNLILQAVPNGKVTLVEGDTMLETL